MKIWIKNKLSHNTHLLRGAFLNIQDFGGPEYNPNLPKIKVGFFSQTKPIFSGTVDKTPLFLDTTGKQEESARERALCQLTECF